MRDKSKGQKKIDGKLRAGWRVLLRRLSKYKRDLKIITVYALLASIFLAAVPFYTGKLIDALTVFQQGGPAKWLLPLVVLFGLKFIGNIIDRKQWLKTNMFALKFRTEYIADGYARLTRLPFSFHKKHGIGKLGGIINRAGGDMARIIENLIVSVGSSLIQVVVGLIMAFSIDISLTLFLLIGIALFFLVLKRYGMDTVNLARKGDNAFDKAYDYSHNIMENIRSVKEYSREDDERRILFNLHARDAVRKWFALEKLWSSLNFSQRMISVTTELLVIAAAIMMIGQGELSVGQLVSFTGYSVMVFSPFWWLTWQWQYMYRAITSFEKAEKILSHPEEIYAPKNGATVSAGAFIGKIEFKDVWFRYDRKEPWVLRGVSFVISPGETVAFVGESGVGKTTMIDLVAAYDFPQKGAVLIDDIPTTRWNLNSLRSLIASVPQEVVLLDASVRENIEYAKSGASADEVREAVRLSHADVFIERFPKKYNQVVGPRGVRLSVGQKQRIGIARAFLREPRILLLDEPTSALDAKSEHYIMDSLKELMKGRTSIIIAHRLSTVEKADTIIVIEDGEIREKGSHGELLLKEDGVYRKFYKLHLGLTQRLLADAPVVSN